MTTCYDAGALRAYLDAELPEDQMPIVADHLAGCATCEDQLAELTALNSQTRQRLHLEDGEDGAMPAADVAFARLRSRLSDERAPAAASLRAKVLAPARRPALALAAIAAALVVVLLLPPARAAANTILQSFRAQSVVFVSVDQQRAQQIANLRVDQNTLFLAKPTRIGAEPALQHVDSVDAAAAQIGFMPQAPTLGLPSAPTTTSYTVLGQSSYSMQVNVKTLRQILATLGVTDVTIPDALGAQPITMTLPPTAQLTYVGKNYTVTLLEGTSPTVNLPSGVDLAQLGRAALEVYGMPSDQAAALSKTIDWRSTLVFPFPTGADRIQQVTVNGAPGMLVEGGHSGAWENIIYWQRGDHFYVLDGQGQATGSTDLLAIANALK